MTPDTGFNLSEVFRTVATAVPDQEMLVWRDLRLTYGQLDARIDGVAHFLAGHGLGCHTPREQLAGHESGQDHIGLYLRNGNEYLEAMVAAYRARLAPFNVNYRYVDEELTQLLTDAGTRALVYHAEFAPEVAALRDRLPALDLLVQVADASGNELLPEAVDYESVISTPPPTGGMPVPSGDDLFLVYTGGTTGMPKGVMWRQDDVYVAAMGGTPFGTDTPFPSYDAIAQAARDGAGGMSLLMVPPFMHAAAQWSTFHMITSAGRVVLLDDVRHFDPAATLRLAARERVVSIPILGDAIARPLAEELEAHEHDLSTLAALSNGSAPLTPTVRARLLEALPHVLILDAVGSSETGIQMNHVSAKGSEAQSGIFTPEWDTTVVDEAITRRLNPGEGTGWLARHGRIPLGYLGDADRTARTFPLIDGVRWSVPGDRATLLADGRIELLGRDCTSINSGGEKVFAEEVERALAGHAAVRDVLVVGRPSERWGAEVVAVVELDVPVSDEDLLEECGRHLARYKVPKSVVRVSKMQRSPSGKADYRWALGQADSVSGVTSTTTGAFLS